MTTPENSSAEKSGISDQLQGLFGTVLRGMVLGAALGVYTTARIFEHAHPPDMSANGNPDRYFNT
jgi:hypothetical protein